MEGRGFIFSMCGQSCSCSGHSSTSARRMASARFSEEMSQPGGHGVTQALGAPRAAGGAPPRPTYRRRRCRWGAPWAAGPGRARTHHPRGRCPGTRWRLAAGSRSSWLSGRGQAGMRGRGAQRGPCTPRVRGWGCRAPLQGREGIGVQDTRAAELGDDPRSQDITGVLLGTLMTWALQGSQWGHSCH